MLQIRVNFVGLNYYNLTSFMTYIIGIFSQQLHIFNTHTHTNNRFPLQTILSKISVAVSIFYVLLINNVGLSMIQVMVKYLFFISLRKWSSFSRVDLFG